MSIRQNLLLHDGCRLSAETAGSTSALLSLPRIHPAGNEEQLDTVTAPSLRQDTSSVCTCCLPSWILNWEERGRERLCWLKSWCFLQNTETGCGDKSWERPLELQKGYAIIILSRTENVWVPIGPWWREGVNMLHAQCSSSRTQWLHTRSAFRRMMPPMLGTFKHLSMNCNSLPSWT